MASDSQTATATTSEKPLENKGNEEANSMEKKIVLEETVDVVKDKPDLTVAEEEKSVQTPAGEPEKEIPADVEKAAAIVKAEESMDKEKDENGEEKVAEQGEFKEPTLVKEGVAEVNVQAEDENGEEKVAEQVGLKEPTLVKESVEEVKIENVGVEKAEEKRAVESVVEEEPKGKEEEKMVDVSESTDEAGSKQVEPVDVQHPREVSAETVDVEVLEVEPKPDTSESGSALCPEEIVPINQDSDTAPKKETEEDASSLSDVIEKAITEENHVVDEPSKDEKASESVSALCPERVVPSNQDSDTSLEKEAEGDVSCPPDVIEKAKTEEKDVVEEPSKDEKEKVSEEAKDVVTKLATEDENIKKENDTESTEVNKQEESITEKIAEVVEAETVAKESDEPKQEPEITTEEVSVKQKHSNSIMSKVKQSLVRAKKAIIGKSPSSKTITTEETKEEVKAK
ncbi:neurofilament protein-related [Raphanus sativus]|uniref:Uncharacterized protein LOC108860096 n=1 Tax=Raphanus sativus TaxID=3726 RepID=A0A6J0NYS4_RAPSA|nr:uncharacterized protein LOC108860096 [Raphanus sativus]KAJ4898461.1 neurofilament protein-related [Raphanus sativus]